MQERQEDLNNQLQNAAVECSMVENTLKKRQSELEQNKAAMDAKQAELVEHEAAEMDLRRRLSLVETESKDKLHELEACNETLSKRNEELESRIEDILQKVIIMLLWRHVKCFAFLDALSRRGESHLSLRRCGKWRR